MDTQFILLPRRVGAALGQKAVLAWGLPVTFTLYLGKTLQLIALATVAAGLLLGIRDRDMWTELLFFVSGITLFVLGSWILKRRP